MMQPDQQLMITASGLARRWGKSTKWVRDNIVKPKALTVYELGRRDPALSLVEVKMFEHLVRVRAEPSARARLEGILLVDGRPGRARNGRGRFFKEEGHESVASGDRAVFGDAATAL